MPQQEPEQQQHAPQPQASRPKRTQITSLTEKYKLPLIDFSYIAIQLPSLYTSRNDYGHQGIPSDFMILLSLLIDVIKISRHNGFILEL